MGRARRARTRPRQRRDRPQIPGVSADVPQLRVHQASSCARSRRPARRESQCLAGRFATRGAVFRATPGMSRPTIVPEAERLTRDRRSSSSGSCDDPTTGCGAPLGSGNPQNDAPPQVGGAGKHRAAEHVYPDHALNVGHRLAYRELRDRQLVASDRERLGAGRRADDVGAADAAPNPLLLALVDSRDAALTNSVRLPPVLSSVETSANGRTAAGTTTVAKPGSRSSDNVVRDGARSTSHSSTASSLPSTSSSSSTTRSRTVTAAGWSCWGLRPPPIPPDVNGAGAGMERRRGA